MAKKKRKKRKPGNPALPRPERRCTYITAAGTQCKKPRVRGEQYCNTHPPEKARELAIQSRAAVAEKKRLADEIAAKYDIRSFGGIAPHVLIMLDDLERDKDKMNAFQYYTIRTNGWKLFGDLFAKQCQYEGGGMRVAVVHYQRPDNSTDFPVPVDARPEPTIVTVGPQFLGEGS